MVPGSNLAEVDVLTTLEGSTCKVLVVDFHDVLRSLAMISSFWVKEASNLSSKALKSIFSIEVGVTGGRIIGGSLPGWQAPVGGWPISVTKSGDCSSLPGGRLNKGEALLKWPVGVVGGVGGKGVGLFSSAIVEGF